MKVALLSFHNAYNYGAALQAFGLQCAVEQIGVDCEYIDYVNEHRKNAYDMSFQLKTAIKEKKVVRAVKVVVGMPIIGKRGKAFDRFYSKYLKKTAMIFHTSKEAEILNEKYDRFIVGSDQVWNPENNGSDMAFLLDFVKDSKKKISYSSSFGISDIPDKFIDKYQLLLSDFSCIAVRESQGVDLVRSLTGKNAFLVLDPVFLAGKSKWDELRKEDNWNQRKKYIFFYTNRSTQVEDFLMTGYKMDGFEKHILSSHVTPTDFLNPNTKVCTSMSPERFLNEVADAELVVTASFHCLAFAIIFHKKFCVLLTGDYGKDERILSLLKIVGLEDRILDINTSYEDLIRDIDYEIVDNKLSEYYEVSFSYLKHAIFEGTYNLNDKKDSQAKYFCDDSRCTGCSACAYSCPVNAIKMQTNDEGFEVPVRNSEKCIDCGKCRTVCQVLCKIPPNIIDQKFYAAKNSDDVRLLSSSGGCFTAISDFILDNNGVVCAAAMDSNYQVKHYFAENTEQRNRMRGTFYVQSSLGHSYEKIAEYLKAKRTVLFIGTPCQVSGLKRIFGENKHLITCDIVCHGVPSPLVFDYFINFLKKKGSLDSFLFRDKAYGYKGYTVSATYNGKKVGRKLWLNSFNNMFSHNMINRLSCSSCLYCNYDRPGDITIGDFWGIENSHPELLDNKGISLLIINNDKGRYLLESIDSLKLTEVMKSDVLQNSLRKSAAASSYRHQAMKIILSDEYEKAAKKYGEDNIKGFIKEIARRVIKV
jgi:coenzyme F420-reducing hydrogenase beta subunit